MSKKLPKPITFRATIPGNQTAIQVHGAAGMRMTLEIPDKQLGNSIRIVEMREYELKVTIEAVPHKSYGLQQKSWEPKT